MVDVEIVAGAVRWQKALAERAGVRNAEGAGADEERAGAEFSLSEEGDRERIAESWSLSSSWSPKLIGIVSVCFLGGLRTRCSDSGSAVES